MNPKARLRALRAKADARINQILELIEKENRALSDDEEKEIETLKAEYERCTRQLKILEDRESRSADPDEDGGEKDGEEEPAGTESTQFRATPPPAKNNPKGGEAKPAAEARKNEPVFRDFASHIRAVFNATVPTVAPEEREKAWNMLREVQERAMRDPEQRTKGLGEKVGQDGGFLVEADISNQIMQRAFDQSLIAPLCGSAQIAAGKDGIRIPAAKDDDRTDGNRMGGVKMTWLDEGEQIPSSKGKLRYVDFKLKKMGGLWYATNEILEDAPFLNSFVQKCFVDESQYVLDEGILFGDGLKQPLGIMNSGALLTIAKESGQTAVLDPLNIVKMFARIFPASSPKATVVINPEIYEYLPTLTLTSGANSYPLFLPPGGFSQMPFGSVYGRKLIPIEHCPAPKTTGDIIAADFSQYLLLRKGDNRLDASMHWAFDTDEWAFRIILRVGGRPLWDKAVTPAKGTSGVKYSPFVCLGAR